MNYITIWTYTNYNLLLKTKYKFIVIQNKHNLLYIYFKSNMQVLSKIVPLDLWHWQTEVKHILTLSLHHKESQNLKRNKLT
jgi:hypothetical protein